MNRYRLLSGDSLSAAEERWASLRSPFGTDTPPALKPGAVDVGNVQTPGAGILPTDRRPATRGAHCF